ncbi:MAG: T9SS type A sorting domain-containing protein, partial [Ignavibacteriaceae bacterium]|nr:T9SS type A sorting domain-containing protein [Ignavibacteriaceae bacterium]
EEVAEVIDEYQSAGSYRINFNRSDLPSGMYVYQLTSGNYSASKKMLILK